MDNFLIRLFEEEQEKIAAADLGEFMDTLSPNELEEFLGLTKSAVAGPAEPELPTSEAGELDKAQKRVDAYAAKVQGQEPPTRKESADAGPLSYQGEHKEVKTASVALLQKVAFRTLGGAARLIGQGAAGGGLLGAGIGGIHGAVSDEGTFLGGLGRGAAIGAGLGAGSTAAGIGASRLLGGRYGRGLADAAEEGIGFVAGPPVTKAEKLRAAAAGLGGQIAGGAAGAYGASKLLPKKEKKSQGLGADDMSGMGGAGGMETTAAMKAKIAMRTIKITQEAPSHIKQAAARFAGQQIAKLGGCMTKTDEFTTPKAQAKAKVMAAAMKMGKGKPASERKKLVGFAGKQV